MVGLLLGVGLRRDDGALLPARRPIAGAAPGQCGACVAGRTAPAAAFRGVRAFSQAGREAARRAACLPLQLLPGTAAVAPRPLSMAPPRPWLTRELPVLPLPPAARLLVNVQPLSVKAAWALNRLAFWIAPPPPRPTTVRLPPP